MTLLNESGVPEVSPPLCGLYRLSRRMPGLLFVVVGAGSEAHLLTTLDPETADRTLFLFPGEQPRQGELASAVVTGTAGFSGVEAVVVLTGAASATAGIDAPFEARIAERRMELPVRAIEISPATSEGWAVLSTDLEDRILAAMVELCPRGVASLPEPEQKKSGIGGLLYRRPREQRRLGKPVVLLGTGEAACEELSRNLWDLGVEVSGCVPQVGSRGLPEINEQTVVAPVDPFLGETCRAAGERGAKVVRTLAPVGINGTARFLQDVAMEAGADLALSESARARRVREELEGLRNRVRGRRVFFTGENGLELPLARFLADAGALMVEVGVPRLDRRMLGVELRTLGSDIDVVETPAWEAQLERIDAANPDLVITSPGLYNTVVGQGHTARLSRELLDAGPYGYSGARRILELVCQSLERAARLDALKP